MDSTVAELLGLRVMVVEDEGLVAMLLEDILTDIGCSVVGIAARLDDALAKARSLEIDVAMLDVNLAGELSYPVAMLLQSRAIPFLFVTGYGSLAIPQELHGTPVLSKPFRQEELVRALKVASQPSPLA